MAAKENYDYSREYLDYMRSEEWLHNKRPMVIQRSMGLCERCGKPPVYGLEVHHKHYRNLTREPLEDLLAVCEVCHPVVDAEREMMKRAAGWMRKVHGNGWERVWSQDYALQAFKHWLQAKGLS